jgi:hypothetical protein
MPTATWMGAEDALTSAELTVRAQAVPPDNTGELFWDAFFETRDVRSPTIRNILAQEEIRYTADRREMNARGRLIPFDMVGTELITITPIESYFRLEEAEINELFFQAQGNTDTFRRLVGVELPDRVDRLARANNRRVEVDCFRAWTTGTLISRNPQLGHVSQTFSYGIDPTRINTAATAWDDPGENAYALFRSWFRTAEQNVGRIEGVVLRQAVYDAIMEDAASAITIGLIPTLTLTRDEFERRVRSELNRPNFRFFIMESTLTEFADGGVNNLTEVELWPEGFIGAIPAVGAPGFVAYAPVKRAYEISRAVPEAKIQLNRNTVYVESGGNGRNVTYECQMFAMPILREDKIFVTDTGVA